MREAAGGRSRRRANESDPVCREPIQRVGRVARGVEKSRKIFFSRERVGCRRDVWRLRPSRSSGPVTPAKRRDCAQPRWRVYRDCARSREASQTPCVESFSPRPGWVDTGVEKSRKIFFFSRARRVSAGRVEALPESPERSRHPCKVPRLCPAYLDCARSHVRRIECLPAPCGIATPAVSPWRLERHSQSPPASQCAKQTCP